MLVFAAALNATRDGHFVASDLVGLMRAQKAASSRGPFKSPEIMTNVLVGAAEVLLVWYCWVTAPNLIKYSSNLPITIFMLARSALNSAE